MTAQHTPGPWRIGALASYDGYTGQPFRNVWAGEDEAATVVARAIRSDGAMTNDVDADALLIAAAPDLLDALKDILQDMEPNPDMRWAGSRAKVCDKARAAIAKATGGEA